jgi:hypothetical protein
MTVDKVLRDACLTGGSMKNRFAIVGILVGTVPNAVGGAVARENNLLLVITSQVALDVLSATTYGESTT